MQEFIYGLLYVILYILPLIMILFPARKILHIPDELFRKILHFVLLGLYIPFLFGFHTWYISVAGILLVMIIAYPVLMLLGHIPTFSRFVNERKSGEFKFSMLLALGMMILSITICWGYLKDKYLLLASIYAWGIGDAFAALIGKRYGKHKIQWKYADSHKSYEGSFAMFVSSVCSVFIILSLRGGLSIMNRLVVACLTAFVCTMVELCTNNGLDTVTCPTAAMIVLLPLVKILGG